MQGRLIHHFLDVHPRPRPSLRLKAAALQDGQARIFWKPRIVKREFAHHENRAAIGFHPSRVLTVTAKAGIGT